MGGIRNWFKEIRLGIMGAQQVFNTVTGFVRAVTDEAIEAEQGLSKVAQAIRSTGGAAGWSAEGLKSIADQLERSVAASFVPLIPDYDDLTADIE